MPQTFRQEYKTTGLDRTDHRIMALLQQNSRRSNKEIAATIGVADSTLSARIRRLEDLGVIQGYHAEIDPEALGIGFQAVIAIRLHHHSREAIAAFWEHTRDLPEAIQVFHITGPNDFLVHLAVADIDHLQRITAEVLTSWREVSHLETSVVYDQQSHGGLPDFAAPQDS